MDWPQAMFSAHCDWGKGGAAILLGIIFKSFELLWDKTSHRFEFPQLPGQVFKMPTSSENWTYATGRERKEDSKPFVTSVTIIMTEKTFRQTSPCKAKITTKNTQVIVLLRLSQNVLPSSSFCHLVNVNSYTTINCSKPFSKDAWFVLRHSTKFLSAVRLKDATKMTRILLTVFS